MSATEAEMLPAPVLPLACAIEPYKPYCHETEELSIHSFPAAVGILRSAFIHDERGHEAAIRFRS